MYYYILVVSTSHSSMSLHFIPPPMFLSIGGSSNAYAELEKPPTKLSILPASATTEDRVKYAHLKAQVFRKELEKEDDTLPVTPLDPTSPIPLKRKRSRPKFFNPVLSDGEIQETRGQTLAEVDKPLHVRFGVNIFCQFNKGEESKMISSGATGVVIDISPIVPTTRTSPTSEESS